MHHRPVALITGANQGIGLQIAKELAAHSFIVLVGSRDLQRSEAAARTIEGDARAIQLDVSDQSSVAAAAGRIRNEFSRLDVLIQNAAISNARLNAGQSVEEIASTTKPSNLNLDEMHRVWETNVLVSWRCIRQCCR